MGNGRVLRELVAQWGCLSVTYLCIPDRRLLVWVRSVGGLSWHFYQAEDVCFVYVRMKEWNLHLRISRTGEKILTLFLVKEEKKQVSADDRLNR